MLSQPLLRLLVKWLRNLPSSELEALAQRQASIVDYLRHRYGSLAVAWARGYLTEDEKAEIAELTDADFDALLDHEFAAACPEQAAVLAHHRAWYRSQMRAVQAALLGRKTTDGRSRSPLVARR